MCGGCPLTLPAADYCLLLQEAFPAFPRPSRPEQPFRLSTALHLGVSQPSGEGRFLFLP